MPGLVGRILCIDGRLMLAHVVAKFLLESILCAVLDAALKDDSQQKEWLEGPSSMPSIIGFPDFLIMVSE